MTLRDRKRIRDGLRNEVISAAIKNQNSAVYYAAAQRYRTNELQIEIGERKRK